MHRIKALHYQSNQPVEVSIEDGMIQSYVTLPEAAASSLPFIAPGLVDLQVNGLHGIDFNAATITTEEIITATDALLATGVTSYYPTVITNSKAHLITCLQAIRQACTASEKVDACIAGIHLEGPFISPEDGPVGAHNKQFVQAPDWPLFCTLNEAAGGKIKIITLSPEWPQAVAFTRQCVQQGIVVSVGHTAANTEQIAAVVAAGATMSTHLGNGSHGVLPRHPNYIWDQLAADSLWAGFIGDDFHLPQSVKKVILKVKGSKAILVSDSVALAGMPPNEYQTPVGGSVVLTSEGKLHLKGKPGTLAGSAQLLLESIQNVVQQKLGTLAEVWNLASIHPAACMGLPQQNALQVGSPADLVLFHYSNQHITIIETYKNGDSLYQA